MMRFVRSAVALAFAALASLTACSNPASKPVAGSPSMDAAVAAFEQNPDDSTFQALHTEILTSGSLNAGSEMRIANRLMAGKISERIANAAAADLATIDFLGTMRYLRAANIAAQINPPRDTPDMVRKTAKLSWLMLALRPYGDKNPVDVSHMDLRVPDASIGRALNLSNIDFTGAHLAAGAWRGADLAGAAFGDVITDGPVVCDTCRWGSARASLRLDDGKWVAR
jgi:hypothetical protein